MRSTSEGVRVSLGRTTFLCGSLATAQETVLLQQAGEVEQGCVLQMRQQADLPANAMLALWICYESCVIPISSSLVAVVVQEKNQPGLQGASKVEN
jgi:hypothetical protein